MRFLLDSNVWLELLLEPKQADEVRRFLLAREGRELALTEFSLYSIAVILTRLNKADVFVEFLRDTVEDSGVDVLRLDSTAFRDAVAMGRQFGLDFDDAYQYVAAARNGLTLLSFDSDFDRTARGRETPGRAIDS